MSDSEDTVVLKRYEPSLKPKVEDEELDFRNREYPDETKFLKKRIIECSSCGKDVKKTITNDFKLRIHPALDVIICDKCDDFYGSGDFSVDEDGSDKYCRWCGQGGSLYCCSYCSVAICMKCVWKNLPKSYMKEIERDDWRCFVCKPKPIWNQRALCSAAKQYVESHSRQRSKRSRKVELSGTESDETEGRSKRLRKEISPENKNKTSPQKKDKTKENSKRRNDSSAEEKEKKERVSQSRPHDADLDVSVMVTPIKIESNPLQQVLLDSVKDFDKFSKVLVKSKTEFIDKYLKNKKYLSDSDRLTIAKKKFLKLLKNAKEGLECLERSFNGGLKRYENDQEITSNGKGDVTTNCDKTPEKESRSNDLTTTTNGDESIDMKSQPINETPNKENKNIEAVSTDDEKTPDRRSGIIEAINTDDVKSPDEKNDACDSVLTNGHNTPNRNEMDETVRSNNSTYVEAKVNPADETDCIKNSDDAMETSTQSEKDTSQKDTSDQREESIAEPPALDDSVLSKSPSVIEESEKEDVFEDAAEEPTRTSCKNFNGTKDVEMDVDLESQNSLVDADVNENTTAVVDDIDVSMTKLSQTSEFSNSSNENEENLKEDEADLSGIDILKADLEEIKAKKTLLSKEDKAKRSLLNDSSSDDDEEEKHSEASIESKKVDQNPESSSNDQKSKEIENHKTKQEDKAKKSFLRSSSSDSDDDGNDDKEMETSRKLKSTITSENESENKKKKEDKARKSLIGGSSSDSDSAEKEINRLTNLQGLDRRRRKTGFFLGTGDEKSDTEEGEKSTCESTAKRKLSVKKQDKSLEEYVSDNNDSDSNVESDEDSLSKFASYLAEKEKGVDDKDNVAKKLFLDSASSIENSADSDALLFEGEMRNVRKKKEMPNKMDDETIESSDDEMKSVSSTKKSGSDEDRGVKEKKQRPKWKNNRLLRGKLSATDTSDEERMLAKYRPSYDIKNKPKNENESSDSEDIFRPKKIISTKRKRRFLLNSSGSDVEIIDGSSSESSDEMERKTKKKFKRRKRIKNVNSDESEDENIFNRSQSSASKGRKNIRHIMEGAELDKETRKTAKEEEARKKRIQERQLLFNKVFKIPDASDQVITKLVLDFDVPSKTELITVSPELLKKLKPHQVKGVKFMWEACFESLKEIEKGKGGGCILAHCMGLGKTLQVITLVHTLLKHESTKVKTILIICPLTTVLNWFAEFEKWLKDLDEYEDMNIYELTKYKNYAIRADHLRHWSTNGGVMILGYEMFRSLVMSKTVKLKNKKQIESALLDPGPDLVICDEGHILKNEKSAISKATMGIKSLRRIVLTGTPLQNNLIEYHCMVQFVKPNLLGNKKEFQNRFVNPITNGQYVDSTVKDVRLMKRRAHVLHRMLDGIVQRFDYNVLKPFLPPKHEFVISVGLSDLQALLYEYYIKNKSQIANEGGPMRLFKDYQIMRLIWTHPLAMKLNADRQQKILDKEESEDSLKNFITSESDSNSSAKSGSVLSVRSDDEKPLRRGRSRKDMDADAEENSPPESASQWWSDFVTNDDIEDYKKGPKLMLLFAILRQCELIGDKVLVFSQSIPSLDMIEYFLQRNDEFSQRLPQDSFISEPNDYVGVWQKNCDYFRLDGQTPHELRSKYCKMFNRPNNLRSRLFLISTKAGGLGINLTAANRVIIFDASWNPSYDIQSIFRVYRFGQEKPCYVYRFLSQGTMEEKIYERQVTKLSVSCRVVDEQQIDRHFSRKDIAELYTFNRKTPCLDEVPKLPSDRLMAELLKEYRDVIISYHEHDSLLENIEEEELTEEERKLAWKDYEEEKNRPYMAPTPRLPTNPLQQNVPRLNDNLIMEALVKEHPGATPAQLMNMATVVRQKLIEYYQHEARVNQGLFAAASSNQAFNAVNSVRNPISEKQMQEQLQMKQAALLHELKSQRAQPGVGTTTGANMPSTSNTTGFERDESTTPTKLKRPQDNDSSSSSYATPVKNASYPSSPFVTPTKNSTRDFGSSPVTTPIKNRLNFDESPCKEPLKTPCTWSLRWNSSEKSVNDLKTLIEMKCSHWRPKAKYTIIGDSLLVHLGFLVRRTTLETMFMQYSISMNIVNPDFEAGESLLGYPPRSPLLRLLATEQNEVEDRFESDSEYGSNFDLKFGSDISEKGSLG